jgi:amino acid transporter/mannitol/fructose-specific phosphotransferase system IIA component (Ntr-type)
MKNRSLNKNLGLFDVFCIASGAMISSGLFVLPGIAHATAGPAVVFSYFLAGLLAATGMLSVAEIITAMPKAGGDYFFITRTVGPAAGAVAGLLSWFSLSLKGSFALLGMSAFLSPVMGIDPLLVSLPIAAIFILLNLLGVHHASRLQSLLVIGLLLLMSLYIFFGAKAVNWQYFEPFTPNGWPAVFATAGLVFVSYGGLLKVAAVAEEIKNPGKIVPMGMILSLLVVGFFYVAIVFVTSGVLGSDILNNSMTPISDGARTFSGQWGSIVMSVAASLAFISTANAGMMAASRYLLALSRDELMPAFLGRVSTKSGVPYNAVIVTGGFVIGSLFLEIQILIKSASTVLILTYLLSNICVIVLRESRLLNYRPRFRSPLYPWTQILGSFGFAILILEMGMETLLISLVLILSGFAFYWFYGRIKATREYALLHLIDRLMNKRLAEGALESELSQIIRQRDELCADPFEEVMKKALIIDLAKPMEKEQFWDMMLDRLSRTFNIQKDILKTEIEQRELGPASEIMPGVAVSDMVVPGNDFFEMVGVRSIQGVKLLDNKDPVETFFIILTSRDKRDSYLHTLAILAQIAGDFSFGHVWKKAKDEDRLRDVLLLTERKRVCYIQESG